MVFRKTGFLELSGRKGENLPNQSTEMACSLLGAREWPEGQVLEYVLDAVFWCWVSYRLSFPVTCFPIHVKILLPPSLMSLVKATAIHTWQFAIPILYIFNFTWLFGTDSAVHTSLNNSYLTKSWTVY